MEIFLKLKNGSVQICVESSQIVIGMFPMLAIENQWNKWGHIVVYMNKFDGKISTKIGKNV